MLTGNQAAVSFKNFSFQYRAQTEPTLIDINVSIGRGEKVLILGPSGSGKSTLIHCINGIIPHAFKGTIGGSLSLLGREMGDLDLFSISKLAGTVLQDTDSQFVGLSAAEDIAFALENDCIDITAMHSRVLETAARVDMEAHLAKSPQDLSGGQRQRTSMAGILVEDVEVLLFDEPLANLDPAAGKDAIELIDDLHTKTGKTIIIVEHRLEDVLHRPVDRIILMDNGRIIADKPPAELLASDLLKRTGIRQPLYLSALEYSGIKIHQEMDLQDLDKLQADYGPLIAWDKEQVLKSREQARIEQEGLAVRNLSFRYEEKGADVLRDISFRVAPGECIGLVGRNGSGKSTMAKCICGFVQPRSGEVLFLGQDLSKYSIMQRAEKIGYVMQNPNQMISFPMIFDEVAFGLRNRAVAEDEIKERVQEVLGICGLWPFRNWPVNALSYGQKKRLTIASILILRPSLIILDEPTAGQDYRHYTEFMEFLMDLNRDMGLSLILITHDMHLMLEYTTRAVVLSEGICVADQEPFEVLTDDDIISKASLKLTSLYTLALKAGLGDPRGFVRRYIAYERSLS